MFLKSNMGKLLLFKRYQFYTVESRHYVLIPDAQTEKGGHKVKEVELLKRSLVWSRQQR